MGNSRNVHVLAVCSYPLADLWSLDMNTNLAGVNTIADSLVFIAILVFVYFILRLMIKET